MRGWILCLITGVASAQADFPSLLGPYLGQPLPGTAPALFAPGIVNCGLPTRDLAIHPDGSEIYFTVMLPGFQRSAICWTRIQNGRWTPPQVAPFAADTRWRTLEPCMAGDGKKLFFVSDRSQRAADSGFGIWVVERRGGGWGQPERLPASVNSGGDSFFPSVTRDGTLYFLKEKGSLRLLMRSRMQDGQYLAAEPLPAPLNRDKVQANPWVDPDERFLIVPIWGRPDSLGGADYYISFRRPEGGWTEPLNLGAPVNSDDGQEYSASLSPDGRLLFFMSARLAEPYKDQPLDYAALMGLRTRPGNGHPAVWWVDAGFIDGLRARALAAR